MFGFRKKDKSDSVHYSSVVDNIAFASGGSSSCKPLWSPNSFILMSVLFSFLSAAMLYSINYGRLGYPKKKRLSIIFSVVACTVFMVIIFIMPDISLTLMSTIAMAVNMGIGAYLMRKQLPFYKNHIGNGGKKASLILPVIFCLILSGLLLWAII